MDATQLAKLTLAPPPLPAPPTARDATYLWKAPPVPLCPPMAPLSTMPAVSTASKGSVATLIASLAQSNCDEQEEEDEERSRSSKSRCSHRRNQGCLLKYTRLSGSKFGKYPEVSRRVELDDEELT